jgi:hypothetical protein
MATWPLRSVRDEGMLILSPEWDRWTEEGWNEGREGGREGRESSGGGKVERG